MRQDLRSFVLGLLATAGLVYAATLATAMTTSPGHDIDVSVGPLRFMLVDRAGAEVTTSFGPGLALLVLMGGGLSVVLGRRARQRRTVRHSLPDGR